MPIIVKCKTTIHYFNYEGHIKIEEMYGVIDEVYNNSPARYIIHDFRKMDTTKLTVEEIKKVSKKLQLKVNTNDRIKKVAFIVRDSVSYGLARMLESYGFEFVTFKIEVFYNIDDAINWFAGIKKR